MTPVTKKWLIFVGVFAFWLVADLWSKHWAETSLATASHPLVARVTDADVGKPLASFIGERFGLDETEAKEAMSHIDKLEPAIEIKSDAMVFANREEISKARGFWVFWRDDLDLSPRRLDRAVELTRVESWLRLQNAGADRRAVQDAALSAWSGVNLGTWSSEVFRKLDPTDIDTLAAEGRIHPIPFANVAQSPVQPVAAGEVYLLTHRQIDVSGDWFKYVYAENPNAAFGFMRGVEPALRHTLFMILTLLAFVAVLVISYRLPVHSRLVLITFAGILSGAVGNFIDRIRYGFVIDFLDMDLGFMHWPTFNIADIAISVGVVVLLIDLTFNKKSVLATPKPSKDDAAAAKPA